MVTPMVGGIKIFHKNPKNYNPVQLLYQMAPGLKFIKKTVRPNSPSIFQTRCDINGLYKTKNLVRIFFLMLIKIILRSYMKFYYIDRNYKCLYYFRLYGQLLKIHYAYLKIK